MPAASGTKHIVRVHGRIPPEVGNRLGTKLIPKLRTACPDLAVSIEFLGSSERDAAALRAEVRQALADLGLASTVEVEAHESTG